MPSPRPRVTPYLAKVEQIEGTRHWASRIFSQRTQIIRHIAELPDHLCIAEINRGRVKRFCAHHCGVGIEAFHRFTSRHAVIGGDERKDDVISVLGRSSRGSKSSAS